MPVHTVRLIVLIAILGIGAVGAKIYLTDPSYGVYGHYRADSVTEIASDTPIYKGAAYCQACHGARYAEWIAGEHPAKDEPGSKK